MLARAGSPLRQWLLSAVIAVGLVAMHHVVAGPTGMSAMDHHAASAGSTMADSVTTPVALVSGEVVSDPGCLDCGAMMGHMCLAVLVALGTLVVALILFTIAPSVRSLLPLVTPGTGTLPARAPPASAVRLAQLGVLRN